MRLIHVPGIDPPERESFGSSSMSGYDENLDDLELELMRNERIRLDILPHIVIKEVSEEVTEEHSERY